MNMRLEHAGAIKTFTDIRSGESIDRHGLAELFAYARTGDTLAVVRLDRLGRSLVELLAIVEQIRGRGIALLRLEEKSTRRRRRANSSFTCSVQSPTSNGG